VTAPAGEIHPSHDPEPDGTRIHVVGRACRRCCRFVEFDGPYPEVTVVGVRPCTPATLRVDNRFLRRYASGAAR
jgi:hypothetical protein